MPQTACERYIFHVMAYAFDFEMPQNRIISFFGSFYVLQLITCFFQNAPLFIFIFLNAPLHMFGVFHNSFRNIVNHQF